MKKQRYLEVLHGICDFIVSFTIWFLFWFIRKKSFELTEIPDITIREWAIATGISIGWISLYWLWGLYHVPYKESLSKILGGLFQSTLIGSLFVFFITYINDPVGSYDAFRYMFLYYFLMQYGGVVLMRLILRWTIKQQINKGKLSFRTLLIGQGKKAYDIYKQLKNKPNPFYRLIGYLPTQQGRPNGRRSRLFGKLKRLGYLEDLPEIIRKRNIEIILIALDKEDYGKIYDILKHCYDNRASVYIVPELQDFLIGNIRVLEILESPPLIEVYPRLLFTREAIIKRVMDITVSLIMLFLCAPLFVIIAILIKLDSKGPVFYTQERIGKNGKPFTIYKFRSMYVDAEKHGPALSSENDPRVTRVGRFLRRLRLDELPQFFNVLKGDMSLVGPRPERRYYIDQIVKKAPEYLHLLKVRPGITSLGQVKFGYAENVDQMIERMKYDLLYLKNFSLILDLKILLYTIIVVLERKGK